MLHSTAVVSTPSVPLRINLRRIAAEAGCHYSTVSLALRNHPRIPRATCEKIQGLARRLGYVPDPMVSSLAYYRNTLRAVGYQATFAWVTNHSSQRGWRKTPIFQAYFDGAAADHITLAANATAWQEWRLTPRVLRDMRGGG